MRKSFIPWRGLKLLPIGCYHALVDEPNGMRAKVWAVGDRYEARVGFVGSISDGYGDRPEEALDNALLKSLEVEKKSLSDYTSFINERESHVAAIYGLIDGVDYA